MAESKIHYNGFESQWRQRYQVAMKTMGLQHSCTAQLYRYIGDSQTKHSVHAQASDTCIRLYRTDDTCRYYDTFFYKIFNYGVNTELTMLSRVEVEIGIILHTEYNYIWDIYICRVWFMWWWYALELHRNDFVFSII